MAISQKLIDLLNGLERLNQAAADVYENAIDRVDRDGVKATLTTFRDNHRAHVQELARLLHAYGVQAGPPSGASGMFLQNVMMLPPQPSDEETLEALQSDEALVNERYREALDVVDLPEDVRQVLNSQRDMKARHLNWIESAIAGRIWETEVETETGVGPRRPRR